ncbi:MAG: FkbM family methyltransferase [Bacteroidales bacterium]|nr:FkbM family methyltransferase [Bacteroidales bacterium]
MKRISRRIAAIRNWHQRLHDYGLRNTCRLFLNHKKEGCYTLRYLGHDFYLRGNSVDFAVFNSIFARGEYDFQTEINPEVIIDAGANIGASAVWLHHRFPGARIIAVEPEATNFDLLRLNTAPYLNISCIRGALFGEDTSLRISDTQVDNYAFRVEKTTVSDDSVPGFTIDSLMRMYDIQQIDILKMDIEGAEYDVFIKEPGKWLSKTRMLIMELHEYFKPGITDLVHGILSSNSFEISRKGENTYARNKSLLQANR